MAVSVNPPTPRLLAWQGTSSDAKWDEDRLTQMSRESFGLPMRTTYTSGSKTPVFIR